VNEADDRHGVLLTSSDVNDGIEQDFQSVRACIASGEAPVAHAV
jgi:hypothetical protein